MVGRNRLQRMSTRWQLSARLDHGWIKTGVRKENGGAFHDASKALNRHAEPIMRRSRMIGSA